MKYLSTLLFLILTFSGQGQSYPSLEGVSSWDTIPEGKAIIYGKFIQRLGFSSGGFAQDIRLINIETNEIVEFTVKPSLKSARENSFMYFIKPGNYAILNYYWTQSTWYGGKIFTEPIFKNIDAMDNLQQKINSGEIKFEKLRQFTFSITENSLNYAGTWHFDTGLVSFTDDKIQLDALKKNKFKKLDFSKADLAIPH